MTEEKKPDVVRFVVRFFAAKASGELTEFAEREIADPEKLPEIFPTSAVGYDLLKQINPNTDQFKYSSAFQPSQADSEQLIERFFLAPVVSKETGQVMISLTTPQTINPFNPSEGFKTIEIPLNTADKIIVDEEYEHLGVKSGVYTAGEYIHEIYPKIKDALLKQKTTGIAI